MRYVRVALNVLPAVCWAIAVAFMVTASFDPDQYFYYSHQERGPFVYPTSDVAVALVAAVIELIVLYAVLRPWSMPVTVLRVASCFVLFATWLWLCSFVVVHAPGYLMVHLLWVFFVALVLAAAIAVMAVRRLWSWTKRFHAA